MAVLRGGGDAYHRSSARREPDSRHPGLDPGPSGGLALPLPVEPITLESLHPSPADLMMAVGELAERRIRRFLLHVLPHGFHRIRHYLSSLRLARQFRTQGHIARARELLAVAPPPEPVEVPEPRDWLPPCPCCGGRMTIIETFGRWRQPRAPPHAPASTGSPRRDPARLALVSNEKRRSIAPMERRRPRRFADLPRGTDMGRGWPRWAVIG